MVASREALSANPTSLSVGCQHLLRNTPEEEDCAATVHLGWLATDANPFHRFDTEIFKDFLLAIVRECD